MTDPMFHRVVDVLLRLIEEAQLTPGETREAAVLASIFYEEKYTPRIG